MGVSLMHIALKTIWQNRRAAPFATAVVYGADLLGQRPLLVQARRTLARKIRVKSVCAPLPSDAATVGRLLIRDSLTLWLETPLKAPDKAVKVLPALLDIKLPFPLEDCVYRMVECGKAPSGAAHILVCVARRAGIEGCLQEYRALGLEPWFLDHEGLALWTGSLAEFPAQTDAARVVIRLECDHVALVIGVGRQYCCAHSVSRNLDAPAPQELLGKIQRVLRAELAPDAPVQWFFCGTAASEAETVLALKEALMREWPGSWTAHADPDVFLARALAGRFLEAGALRCDLRQDAMLHPRVRSAIAVRARRAALLTLAAGLVLIGLNVTVLCAGQTRLERMRAAVAGLARELTGAAAVPYGREAAEAQKALDRQLAQMEPFLRMALPSPAIELAGIMRAGQAAGVSYQSLTFRRSDLAIKGSARDWDQCDLLQRLLEGLGYTVTLDRQEALAEDSVRFSVQARKGGL